MQILGYLKPTSLAIILANDDMPGEMEAKVWRALVNIVGEEEANMMVVNAHEQTLPTLPNLYS